ncbi:MAG: ribosome silencing factor, partial [Desulfobacula sp.]|nr:ribosome silencing factor [Desulfobacula sp.]
IGMEGLRDSEWALLDYGEVVIHIFESKAKSFFDLEGLWADAPRIDLLELEKIHGQKED